MAVRALTIGIDVSSDVPRSGEYRRVATNLLKEAASHLDEMSIAFVEEVTRKVDGVVSVVDEQHFLRTRSFDGSNLILSALASAIIAGA